MIDTKFQKLVHSSIVTRRIVGGGQEKTSVRQMKKTSASRLFYKSSVKGDDCWNRLTKGRRWWWRKGWGLFYKLYLLNRSRIQALFTQTWSSLRSLCRCNRLSLQWVSVSIHRSICCCCCLCLKLFGDWLNGNHLAGWCSQEVVCVFLIAVSGFSFLKLFRVVQNTKFTLYITIEAIFPITNSNL